MVTEHGLAMLREGEAIFEDLKAEWTRQVGAADIERLETILRRLVGSPPVCLDDLGVGTKTAEKTA